MLRINISTRPILLDYNIQNAQLNLQSTQPKVQIETMPAKLEIRQPQGKLTIDNTPYRYSIGLKNMADFARDNAALGRQTAMDTIAQIVEEGNLMARITSKSNAIADLAADSSLVEASDITWAPIVAPSIHYQAKPAQITATAGKVNITPQPGSVQGDYQPGSVDIRVTQYPSIKISAVDVKA
ncbi:MAG: DUF6470 family protein [Desulfitobacterium hafniense]|nr:DUF6470 family protein [Desulfitobacterium hafniense]